MRSLAALMVCGWQAMHALADDSACTELTKFTEAELATYQFNVAGDAAAMRQLEPDRVYVTGDVRIVVQPIFNPFDPAENGWLYSWANRLHPKTRPNVIQEVILFHTGSRVQRASLLESERILRAESYIYDARVIPRRLCGDRVDVDVVVREVWTLYPSLDFSRSGGHNAVKYGLVDTNLFGDGRTLSVFFSKDQDRDSKGLFYSNPNVGGSRVKFETLVENSSDGERLVVELGQPFYGLDVRRALESRFEDTDAEQGLYQFGDKVSEFRDKLVSFDLNGGISNGLQEGRTWRWLAGYAYEEHKFSPVPGSVPPNPFPPDRTLGYPWVGFASIEDRFDKTINVDRIYRTEDVDLGRRYAMRLGWSDSAFGGDSQSRIVFAGDYRDGLRSRDAKRLLFYGADLRGYWNLDLDETEQVWAHAYATFRQQRSGRFSLAGTLQGVMTHNLPPDEQLLGGGDTGLRGYPNRYQSGDRSVLFSLEERYFSDIYLARIVRLGFAAFVDAGRTWFSDSPDNHGYGALADVGIGLRFESTRTRQDRVLHVDFAFPLVDGPDVQTMQILVEVQDRF